MAHVFYFAGTLMRQTAAAFASSVLLCLPTVWASDFAAGLSYAPSADNGAASLSEALQSSPELSSAQAPVSGAPIPLEAALQTVQEIVDTLKDAYAPDERTAVFDIHLSTIEDDLVLSGETDRRDALSALKRKLRAQKIPVSLEIRLLPDDSPDVGDTPWALVSVPVANFSARPVFASPLTTQATAGTPLKLLEKEGSFWRAQLPDGYIGWVHGMQIVPLTSEALSEWNAADKVIVIDNAARLEDASGAMMAPLPATSTLKLIDRVSDGARVRAQLPDGRVGFVAATAVRDFNAYFDEWELLRKGSREAFWDAFFSRAKDFTGTAYLWGGTTAYGFDCSGFISTLWRITGVITGRDADQQIAAAQALSIQTLDHIPKGTLLAFGARRSDGTGEVEHIALSLGAGTFIHSLGSVRVESLIETSAQYSAYEKSRFLDAYAFDPALIETPCISTVKTNGFYQTPPRELAPCQRK